MKTKRGLAYWKARKITAQAACEQAKSEYYAAFKDEEKVDRYRFWLQMVTHATKKVNELEHDLGVTK
jgi:hypothetical protein